MQLEYMAYEEYPSDDYTKAIFTLRKDGDDELTFGLKKNKDGGYFWVTAGFGVNDGSGSKKYFNCWKNDSSKKTKEIIDFIEATVKQLKGGKAPIAQSANVFDQPFKNDNIEPTLPF